MDNESAQLPPVVRLKYKPGETVIKGGDYGISIYQILQGSVEIFLESAEEDVRLAILGPGEIIGEMIFLTGNTARRSASVRAREHTVLEAWHPARISREYGSMPLVLRYMANQIVKRLIRMNRMIAELEAVKSRGKIKKAHTDPWSSQRKFYRKNVDIECMYRLVADSPKSSLWGKIKDISKTGMRLETPEPNSLRCPHKHGAVFFCSAFLPTGKRFDVHAKIVRLHEPPEKGVLSLGMRFEDVDQDTQKVLGFFLMP